MNLKNLIKTKRIKSISFGVIIGILGLILLVGSFYLGYQIRGKNNPAVIIQGAPAGVNFEIFWDAWQIVRNNYLKSQTLVNENLVYGAINGLIKSLNDPYSEFLKPDDSKKFTEDLSGAFSGIGAEIGIRKEQLVIIAPLKGSPAERAGLRAGDQILKIDETPAIDLNVNEAVKIIRGPKDSKVVLTILRDEWEKPKEFPITREEINIPTIELVRHSNGINQIKVFNFNENLSFEFYKTALDVLFSSPRPRGIILDLRNNPGGYLEVAVYIAGWFLDRGDIVVKEEFQNGEVTIFRANGNGALKYLPLVILVNKGSASASEILAGALRDQRGIKLIGEKTFGKGTVQEMKPLKDGSTIKITVAHWLLPKGKAIEEVGLVPDYEVAISDKDIEAGRDPQLDKAIEILKGEFNNF